MLKLARTSSFFVLLSLLASSSSSAAVSVAADELETRKLPKSYKKGGKKGSSSMAPQRKKIPGGCDPDDMTYFTTVLATYSDLESLAMKEFVLENGGDPSAPDGPDMLNYIEFMEEYFTPEFSFDFELTNYNTGNSLNLVFAPRDAVIKGPNSFVKAFGPSGFENLNGIGVSATCSGDGSALVVLRSVSYFIRFENVIGNNTFFENGISNYRAELAFNVEGMVESAVSKLDNFARVEYTGP